MQCLYCSKSLTTDYILKTHQRTSKACLAIQAEKGVSIDQFNYECIHCTKKFTSQQRLDTHLSICKTNPLHSKPSVIVQDDTHTVPSEPLVLTTDAIVESATNTIPSDQELRNTVESSVSSESINTVVPEKKQFPCSSCQKLFSSKQSVSNHIIKCKENIKPILEVPQPITTKENDILILLQLKHEHDIKELYKVQEIQYALLLHLEKKIEHEYLDLHNTKVDFDTKLRMKNGHVDELEYMLKDTRLQLYNVLFDKTDGDKQDPSTDKTISK